MTDEIGAGRFDQAGKNILPVSAARLPEGGLSRHGFDDSVLSAPNTEIGAVRPQPADHRLMEDCAGLENEILPCHAVSLVFRGWSPAWLTVRLVIQMDNVNDKITHASDFGARLRSERELMLLSQEALGAAGGVKKNAQHNYETGKRLPDASYLAAIAAAGVDVLYVLTGERRSGLPAPTAHQLPARLRERLADAIEAIEEGLAATNRTAQPRVKAELVLAAYDILASQGESASAEIIRLVRG